LIQEIRKLVASQKKGQTKKKKQHYVPIWYQKRFLPIGQKTYHYLNLQPSERLSDGREIKLREIYNWGPGSCFYQKDLYTTKFWGIRNEDIEEHLFGKIDNDGIKAIQGLLSGDPKLLSEFFSSAFIYMDAQKLRTPKGLDWIRSNYYQLSYVELMLEMQYLRTMHCTMWVEGVMEIVSAEDSDVKFIISDHPVTVYNYACPPASEICQYPNDPHTAWMASQTIFPLDRNHCFILTNLEYARDPDGVDPLTCRTNPRHFAQTITRWDVVLRDRKLKTEEVCAINYVIKARAKKYIAAGHPDWMYPEKIVPDNKAWESAHQVLLPPKEGLWHFGGEIYAGGEDGKLAWYQDAFGRQHTVRENADDPIRKYSIQERNQILCNAIYKIFGFSEGKDWDDFRRELTDEKIREFYGVVGALWNPDTEIMSLMPKPGDTLSAFYNGTIDPRITPMTVVAYSLYVDRIILLSPFPNPRVMKKEYSPYESPAQYREDTIKNILLIMQIIPLIETGIVEMIPDPCDFDPYFRERIYKMGKARMEGRKLKKEDVEQGMLLMRDDYKRSLLSMPTEVIKRQMKKAMPDISKKDLEAAIEYSQRLRQADPLAPLQPIKPGKADGQLKFYHTGGNLEMALYLAQVTGSYIYTDIEFRWQELRSSPHRRGDAIDFDPWAPLYRALNDFQMTLHPGLDPRFLCHLKEQGVFNELISLFRKIITAVRTIEDLASASALAKEFADSINCIDTDQIWDSIEKEYEQFSKGESVALQRYKVTGAYRYFMPFGGLSSNTITQLLLTHGFNTPYWNAVPFGAYMDLKKIIPVKKI
jgi:hypothetical protein